MDPVLADLVKSVVPLFAVLLTWLLTTRAQRARERREAVVAWHTLLLEITECQQRLRSVANAGVMAPLYRLPTSAYQVHFYRLMMQTDLAPSEMQAFDHYYSFVKQVNDGLDLAASAAEKHDNSEVERQFNRNRAKALKVVEKEGQPESPFDATRAVIYQNLERLGDSRHIEWLKTLKRPAIPQAGQIEHAQS